jgi:hypothetical protein
MSALTDAADDWTGRPAEDRDRLDDAGANGFVAGAMWALNEAQRIVENGIPIHKSVAWRPGGLLELSKAIYELRVDTSVNEGADDA